METISVRPGETKVVFFFINLSGTLYYNIQNQTGTNIAKFWWIKGPFGSVEEIGELKGSGNIPFRGLLWGRLKVSFVDSLTYIQVSERAEVANNFPSIEF